MSWIIECSYLQITLLKMEVEFQDFRGIFCSLFWKKPIADSGNFCTLPTHHGFFSSSHYRSNKVLGRIPDWERGITWKLSNVNRFYTNRFMKLEIGRQNIIILLWK
jgi:hypothetical protein